MDNQRIGIFGGTFNPPHNGHTMSARVFYDMAGLDKLIVVPSNIPPHKDIAHGVTPSQRYDMSSLAFGSIPGYDIEVSDIELRSPGVSYTYHTVKTIAERYDIRHPSHLFFLMGSDMLLSVDTWYNARELMKLCTITTAERYDPHTGYGDLITKRKAMLERDFGASVLLLENPPVEISSTSLRSKIMNGTLDEESAMRFLHPEVYRYIQSNRLYGKD